MMFAIDFMMKNSTAYIFHYSNSVERFFFFSFLCLFHFIFFFLFCLFSIRLWSLSWLRKQYVIQLRPCECDVRFALQSMQKAFFSVFYFLFSTIEKSHPSMLCTQFMYVVFHLLSSFVSELLTNESVFYFLVIIIKYSVFI